MNSFKIYTPIKKFYFTPNILIYGILIIGVLPSFFESIFFPNDLNSFFSRVLSIIGFGTYLINLVIFGIIGQNKDKPLKGLINGEVVFDIDKIIIHNNEYFLSEIENIRFSAFDYYKGLVETYRRHNFNGRMSLGVENEVILSLKNGNELKINFQQSKRYQIRNIREQLINYHNDGKLHFLNLIDILGIEDYNAIQNFKRSLSFKDS